MRCVLPGPRTCIVCGNCIRETSVKRRNKIVQNITRNVANVFSFYAIIAIKHGFQCINIRQIPREVLKTAASGLVFNTSIRTWRMLMHEKPCLIPILNAMFSRRNKKFCVDIPSYLELCLTLSSSTFPSNKALDVKWFTHSWTLSFGREANKMRNSSSIQFWNINVLKIRQKITLSFCLQYLSNLIHMFKGK